MKKKETFFLFFRLRIYEVFSAIFMKFGGFFAKTSEKGGVRNPEFRAESREQLGHYENFSRCTHFWINWRKSFMKFGAELKDIKFSLFLNFF